MKSNSENLSVKREKLDKALSKSFLCPILQEYMSDPVVAADGYSYERAAITQWIETRGARALSPMTGTQLSHLDLTPNLTLRTIIGSFKDSLPQRRERELTEQTLNLAIQLREEELLTILEKHEQLLSKAIEEKASVTRQLTPIVNDNRRLNEQLQQLQFNTQILHQEKNIAADEIISAHLSEINSLSLIFCELIEAHAANMIKRLILSRITRMKLNQTQWVHEEQKILTELRNLGEEHLKKQTEITRKYEISLERHDRELKNSLAEIGKKLSLHSGEEGDDHIAEQLIQQRKKIREASVVNRDMLLKNYESSLSEQANEHELKIQDRKFKLQKIKASVANKHNDLSRWTNYVKKITDNIEIERVKLFEVSEARTHRSKQLTIYSEEAGRRVSHLFAAQRKQEESKAHLLAKQQLKQEAQREMAILSQLTSKERALQKHQGIEKFVTENELAQLLNYTVRGELDKVSICLLRNKNLVHAQGNIKDLSGRDFCQITGFQYAIWSGDEELWNIFLEFLSGLEAYDQLMTLINHRPDITRKHGLPLSFFDGLINTYEYFMNNWDEWFKSDLWKQMETCWKDVWKMQHNMPAWFIYQFTEKGVNSSWSTKSVTESFSRETKNLSLWFTGTSTTHKCSGVECNTCGWCRGAGENAFRQVGSLVGPKRQHSQCVCAPFDRLVGFDNTNTISLKLDRMEKLEALREHLEHQSRIALSPSSVMINTK